MKVKFAQCCPTLCDPMYYTVHGIFQTRILENSIDRGAWWATVHGAKESDTTEHKEKIACFFYGKIFPN